MVNGRSQFAVVGFGGPLYLYLHYRTGNGPKIAILFYMDIMVSRIHLSRYFRMDAVLKLRKIAFFSKPIWKS